MSKFRYIKNRGKTWKQLDHWFLFSAYIMYYQSNIKLCFCEHRLRTLYCVKESKEALNPQLTPMVDMLHQLKWPCITSIFSSTKASTNSKNLFLLSNKTFPKIIHFLNSFLCVCVCVDKLQLLWVGSQAHKNGKEWGSRCSFLFNFLSLSYISTT